jgi:hypothetical protein
VSKLALLSIIIATMAIPMPLARAKDAAVALKKVRNRTMIFLAVYIFILAFVYERLL